MNAGRLPSISVVIPTYNMGSFLQPLWDSLCAAGVVDVANEVIFVNDASTDQTREAIDRLAAQPDARNRKIRPLHLERNQGRFLARFEGAQAARGERILFLDSRLTLPEDFGPVLARLAPEHRNVIGTVDIDIRRSVFTLYWERSHRAIFRRHYRDAAKPLTLTPENYDRYLKGTTVFLCSRELFLAACRKFKDTPLLNDDTYLMKEMVQHEPLVIHPDLRISWVPREDWRAFLARLWERGPSFVEYHVFATRGAFFYIVLMGLAAIAAWAVLTWLNPATGLSIAAGALAALVLSTAVFAKGPIEFIRLAPLHSAVVLTFGTAILRGIWVNLARTLRGQGPTGQANGATR